jgi:hypothetical protein
MQDSPYTEIDEFSAQPDQLQTQKTFLRFKDVPAAKPCAAFAIVANFADFSSPATRRSRHITSGAVMPISAISKAKLRPKL